ncbi:MAG: histidine phosphatase family protein [Betaproteobacteria bacterium]|nr:histidine phosphatase family protein [Betaproteobacteria bacterium]
MIVSFLRHGSTAWNEQGRMQGRRNIPLSARGRDEVRAWRVPADPAVPVQWVSSPLRRAVETAQLLSGAKPRRENALTEMDWGEWEGFRLDELRARFGAEFARMEMLGLDFRPPGGESPRDVLHRVQHWLACAAADEDPIVAVSHNGVLRVVLAAATGWDMTCKPPIRLQPGTLHRFAVAHDGTISLVECNVPLAPGAAVDVPSAVTAGIPAGVSPAKP